jgi:peptidoglycan/LPS O-acetylase OafA/YrhL
MTGNYRPEIDGLRAVSVLAVVLYHAEFILAGGVQVSGGYLGVDIFFVISGYLISKIILTEVRNTGSFSFRNFYMRRIRRISPALITVILVSLPFAWWLLLPSQLEEFAWSILATFAFVSNHYFSSVTTAYAADSSLLKPLLHTWSLSVEEQFYILFPPLILFLHKVFRRRLGIALLVLFALSLILAEVLAFRNPELNFYWLPSRAWELLTGVFVALVELRYGRVKNNVLPAIGLLMIIGSIIAFNEDTRHPGLLTLVPIIGSTLVIYFSNGKDFAGRLLASKPFVWTGLISYSLYLWHFPIFAFARIQNPDLSNTDKAELVVLSLVASIAAFFLVEKPFRQARITPTPIALSSVGIFTASIATFSCLVLLHAGYLSRIPPIFRDESILKPVAFPLSDNNGRCVNRSSNYCVFEPENPEAFVIFVGDSHAGRIISPFLKTYGTRYSIADMTAPACPLVSEFNKYRWNGDLQECSAEFQESRMNFIRSNPGSIVVLIARWPLYIEGYYFDNEEGGVEGATDAQAEPASFGFTFEDSIGNRLLEQGLADTIQEILNAGSSVVIVYPIPEVGINVPQNLFANKPSTTSMQEIRNYLRDKSITTSNAVFEKRTASTFNVFDRLQDPRIKRVFPHKFFCDNGVEGRCTTHDENNIFYADDDHPSTYAAELINVEIDAQIRALE